MVDTALLVIDVQHGLFQKSTPIYQADRLIANLRLLLERARLAGAPVFFIQHSTDKVLVRGTPEWQFHPLVQPAEGDRVVEKHRGDSFDGTGLKAQLDELGVRRVVVCGLVTHGCVRASSLGALAEGYEVVLVSDAHSSYAKDAAKKIEQVNQELSAENVTLKPAAEVSF